MEREIKVTLKVNNEGVSTGAALIWWLLVFAVIFCCRFDSRPSLYDALLTYLTK